MRTTAVITGVAAAVAVVSALAAGPAAADPMQQAPDALVLTVSNANAATSPGSERAVTLSCTPDPAGDHPDPAAACDSLLGVHGDIAALAAGGSVCPEIYVPVTATAVGVWNGQSYSYEQTFTNECFLLRATGTVFAF